MRQPIHTQTPSWLDAVAGDPMDALPVHGLTTLQFSSAEVPQLEGDWATAVLPMAADLVTGGRPVFWVESGGIGSTVSGPYVRAVCGDSDLLFVHEDEDDILTRAPAGFDYRRPDLEKITGGRYNVLGCVPSLGNISADLERHDSSYGTSAVIFDQAQMLRPYWNVTDTEGSPPYRMPVRVADQWRAADLLEFATPRAAQTIAVWDTWPGDPAALEAVISVSLTRVVVLRQPGADAALVTVRRRDALTAAWSWAKSWTVPRYDIDQLVISE